MPLPKRRKSEKVSDWISRCMGDENVKEEFSSRDQRLGYCYSFVENSEKFVNNLFTFVQNYEITYKTFNGKRHIVAPAILLVEGVHNGSGGSLYYSAEELSKYPEAWNGIELPVQHPERDGQYVSCNCPDIIEANSVGRLFNVHFGEDNKLRGEIWVDEEKARAKAPQVLSLLRKKEPLEISTGLFSDLDISPGEWNGEYYDAVVRNIRPDHLALLPGGRGACSYNDGCGVRTNEEKGEEMDKEKYLLNFVLANAEEGMKEVISSIQGKLDAMDNEYKIHFLIEAFDSYFVYQVNTYAPEGGNSSTKLYRREYSIEDGVVTFGEEVVEVIEKTSYEPVTNEKGEEPKMGDKKNKNPKANEKNCCEELVTMLIENENTSFDEEDREWLSSLDESTLKKLEPKEKEAPVSNEKNPVEKAVEKGAEGVTANENKGEEKTKANTVDEYIANAPAEMQEVLRSGYRMHTEKKTAIVNAILANKSNKFSEDQLKKKDLDELENIQALMGTGSKDYSGANPEVNTSGEDSDEEEPMDIPVMFANRDKK